METSLAISGNQSQATGEKKRSFFKTNQRSRGLHAVHHEDKDSISGSSGASIIGEVLEELPYDYISQSRNVASQQEISSLSSGSPNFTGVKEKWASITNIDARILEVVDEKVKLECLISASNNEFQERVFERTLLEGAVNLEVGSYILIRIFKRSGKITFAFHNGDDIVRKDAFEDLSRFDDLEDMQLDRMAEQQ